MQSGETASRMASLQRASSMEMPRISRDTARTLVNYLTYQAVCVIRDQLAETNPAGAYRLQVFSADFSFQDGEAYLAALLNHDRELALRVMTVREHLAEHILDYLPEMTIAQIRNANTNHRRTLLERLTRVAEKPPRSPENIDDTVAVDESSDPSHAD